MTTDTLDVPGFADPVGDAQATFRAILDAIARPGRIVSIGSGLLPPRPLDASTAALALTLLDHETLVFLDPVMRAAEAWLAFHAGARFTADVTQADYVLACDYHDLRSLRDGTDETPETSATLIWQVTALGVGAPYQLSGPGLAAPAILHVDGLPDDFTAAWQRNHARFPRGIDIMLCAGDRAAALPRSAVLEDV